MKSKSLAKELEAVINSPPAWTNRKAAQVLGMSERQLYRLLSGESQCRPRDIEYLKMLKQRK